MGSSLAKHLSGTFDVTAIDIKQSQGFDGRFQACDLRDKQRITELVDSFDLLINTAIIQVPEINEKKRLGYEVNVLGAQNLCEAVEASASLKGLIHASSWHVFGEAGIKGTLTEEYGYRPDTVEQRARLYALCKIAQESIIRIHSEMSRKRYGIIRLGTVLGDNMPKQTAANLFIEKALKDEPMTPFKDTQHRPMLYVNIRDVCNAFESFAVRILDGKLVKQDEAPSTVNLVFPAPVTIIELARMVRTSVIRLSDGRKTPRINVIDRGIKPVYAAGAKRRIKVDITKARNLLGLRKLMSPKESIEQIVAGRLNSLQ